MSQFIQPINLEVSPGSLNQGEDAIRQELALQLYVQNVFTFGQARHLANLSVWEFQQLLGQKKIERHYNEAELTQDVETIEAAFEGL
jgi:predicted HTH domain antitoxin